MNQGPALNTPELRIIICDDDHDDQYLLKKAIKSSKINCEVISVYNGLQLMDFLHDKKAIQDHDKPGIIFLDLNMPLLDGFGVLRQMKEQNFLGKIPVYMLSTSSLAQDKTNALKLGATDFYVKPADFEFFKNIVKEVCSRHLTNFNR